MKQSSIEWIYNNLKSHFEHDGDLLEAVQMSFKQAKAMHKEEMCEFAYKCRNIMAADEFAINHWYDKTFNEADITTSVSNVSELVCTQCGGKKDIKFSAMKNFQAYCEDCRDE